ncbi:aldehyde dehydrogenase [Mycena amicta]|nr:aldehyde dehydrogenase [Mycena amicta]
MPGTTFTYDFKTHAFTGKTSFPTGLFIDGEFRDGAGNTTIDVVNPSDGSYVTKVSEATPADVDTAVLAAQKAFDTVWGLGVSGAQRGELLYKLAVLMQRDVDELSAIESLDVGKTFWYSRNIDVPFSIQLIKYYAGWADKITGDTIETDERKLAYTRHEPFGVVGQIIPWNFPLMMVAFKLGPALATGNTIVLKPSEFTPLTALKMCSLIQEAGFPKGVVNVLVGYGNTVGEAISKHMDIQKIAFTGSTLVGRKIMAAAAMSNLKNVTLELGGKSPNIVFDDADLDQAVKWSAHGIFWNHGQACCAGSRIFVQAGIYDDFLQRFTERARMMQLGDPFADGVQQGPQVNQIQFDRIMSYIDSGRQDGATLHLGGARHGETGYFIQPTIFTDTKPEMKIVQEEIFGPVGVIIKFTDEADMIRQANNTLYGLAAAVFSQNMTRAIETAHKIQAGTVWVNCMNHFDSAIPFGGYKQSGIGRELGEAALANYTNVKAIHVNLGHRM